jgi:hypothetical protein
MTSKYDYIKTRIDLGNDITDIFSDCVSSELFNNLDNDQLFSLMAMVLSSVSDTRVTAIAVKCEVFNKTYTDRAISIYHTVNELHQQANKTQSIEYMQALRSVMAGIEIEYYDLHSQLTIDYSLEVANRLFTDLDKLDFVIN